MTKVEAIFTFSIDAIGKKKVSQLLQKFGYSGEPTAELCMEVMDKEGKAFALPFGKLMRKAAKNPQTKAKLLEAASLSKAGGAQGAAAGVNGAATTGSTLTAQQKSDMGLQWFEKIASLVGVTLNSVDDIANATNGTNLNSSLALLQSEERKKEEAAQKTTLYWILGGIGILLIVTIFVIALSKRS